MNTTEIIGIIGAVTAFLTAVTGVLVAVRNLRNSNGNHDDNPVETNGHSPVAASVKTIPPAS